MKFRDDIASIVEAKNALKSPQAIEDLLFQAKFLSKAKAVIARVGEGADDVKSMSTELGSSLEKVSTYLRSILDQLDDARRVRFAETFLNLTPESLTRLFGLCEELGWIKNYLLDKKRIRGNV
jgi:hypothetical protein